LDVTPVFQKELSIMSKIIAAAIVLTWANPVFAADVIGRDAAIKKCNAESRVPRGKYYDWDGVWNATAGRPSRPPAPSAAVVPRNARLLLSRFMSLAP
jgi:hypothetical protein